jgi:hypothetical protein
VGFAAFKLPICQAELLAAILGLPLFFEIEYHARDI